MVSEASAAVISSRTRSTSSSSAGPAPKNAANALIMIGYVADSCDEEAASAVKAAERAVRDVVVLRCCSVSEARNPETFIVAAEEAFGRGGEPLGRELKAVLLLAYHKLHRA